MKSLVLLHGAIGSHEQLRPLRNELLSSFHTHSFNFAGHGGAEMPETFSIAFFAQQVYDWVKKKQLEKVSIFGYSMGGYVGMCLARTHPEIIASVVTLATKFDWNPQTAAKEVKQLQPAVIEQKLPKFAEQLKERHKPHDWKMVLQKTADMLTQMGEDNPLTASDYQSISCPTLLMLGDRDKMISLDETIAVYRQLPNAQLAVLPNTPHPIEMMNVDLLKFVLEGFMKGV